LLEIVTESESESEKSGSKSLFGLESLCRLLSRSARPVEKRGGRQYIGGGSLSLRFTRALHSLLRVTSHIGLVIKFRLNAVPSHEVVFCPFSVVVREQLALCVFLSADFAVRSATL
jgi:hypothetical protein